MSVAGHTYALQLTCLLSPVLSMQAGLEAMRPQQRQLLGRPKCCRELLVKTGAYAEHVEWAPLQRDPLVADELRREHLLRAQLRCRSGSSQTLTVAASLAWTYGGRSCRDAGNGRGLRGQQSGVDLPSAGQAMLCAACGCDTLLPSMAAGALTQKDLWWSLHVHHFPGLHLQSLPLCGCHRPA